MGRIVEPKKAVNIESCDPAVLRDLFAAPAKVVGFESG
jgi:hypothetical protein